MELYIFTHTLSLRPLLSLYSELKPDAELRTVHPRISQITVNAIPWL
jgi:hypothetical protein